jgi:hypothetical protein
LVSFTQIDQYLRCPLQIPIPLYRRLEPDVVPAARAFGSGIHAAAAVLFRNVAHGERQRVEGVQGCFERFWRSDASPSGTARSFARPDTVIVE